MKIGIVGAGQLGQMLALAGIPLGHSFRFLWDSSDVPCQGLGEFHLGKLDSSEVLKRFCEGIDIVTYEFENVPISTAQFLEQNVLVYPPIKALECAQDRFLEKSLFVELGIPTPKFIKVDSTTSVDEISSHVGYPFVLKTRRMGYDGKGQAVVTSRADFDGAVQKLKSKELIAEEFVNFSRELSAIGIRGISGETRTYSLVENTHSSGILSQSIFPAPNVPAALEESAKDYTAKILNHFKYVGVLALELFEVSGKLVANEMAPRVHNSGHVTIEAAVTSQFENHLRAITEMHLGDCSVREAGVMFNLLGNAPPVENMLQIRGAHLHLYGKTPKPGRKIGHITILGRKDEEIGMIRSLIQNAQSLV